MILEVELIDVESKPLFARSGHKVVSDDKYLYVVGGYVEKNTLLNNHEVRGEIWRYHFFHKSWEKCIFDKQLFTLGASHSAVKIGECIFITGGTGFPFGVNILKSLIVVNVKKMTQRQFSFIPKNNKSANLPIATYGHTMTYVYINKNPYLYICGGTTGETYHQEMYQVNLLTLESELVSDNDAKNAPTPRYKHEAFLYKDSIYVLGGAMGTDLCHDLNQIHAFDIFTKMWRIVKTNVPIEVCLRCPSMSQNGQYIYMSGGYTNTNNISNTIYQLDLEHLTWTAIASWSSPSYFHDGAFVPQLGLMFLFGGVQRIMPSHQRNNNLFMFRPPSGRVSQSLTDLSWQTVLRKVLNETLITAGEGPTPAAVIDYLIKIGVPGYMLSRITASDSEESHAA